MKTRDKFSPYSLRLYDAECAKQYYFEYLDSYTSDFRYKPQLKQILVEDGRSQDLVFGDVVHRTLNDFFHLDSAERTAGKLIDILKNTWSGPRGKEKGFPQIEDERDHYRRARDLLQRFAKTQELNPEIAYLPRTEGEGEFVKENLLTFPLEPGTILQGKIDRIDKEGNGYHLIDYKTSRRESHTNLQLFAYAILSRQALGKPITKASYLYLETGNFRSYPVTELIEQETKERIMQLIAKIRSDEKFTPNPGRRCYWCPYVEFCPAKDQALEYISQLKGKKGEVETSDLPF